MLSNNPISKKRITWRKVQDRYKFLQDNYNASDNENKRLSGVDGGEMGELADLRMPMRKARDDMQDKKNKKNNELKWKDEEKKQAGKRIVEAAAVCKRKTQADSIEVDEEDDNRSR